MATVTIFTDGGSRGNPGPSAIGGVFLYQDQKIYEFSQHIGVATNNEAEYQAFLHSLERVINNFKSEWTSIQWYLDSKLVVEQLNKRWKAKDGRMQFYVKSADELLKKITIPYTIEYVPRKDNAIADALVNQALDSQLA